VICFASFYCIVLLTTLFVSSCYWQPFPLDSPLSTPWADNITTFSEALSSTIMPNYSKPLPVVMRTVDRCWCDFSAGGFFEPFNVSHWEHVSVERLKDDLEHQQNAEDTVFQITETVKLGTQTSQMPRTAAPAPSLVRPKNRKTMSVDYWALFFYPLYSRPNYVSSSSSSSTPYVSSSSPSKPKTTASGSHSNMNLPLIRKEYDLRPYGFGIFIDFGWTR
jgi:hypothetical protein